MEISTAVSGMVVTMTQTRAKEPPKQEQLIDLSIVGLGCRLHVNISLGTGGLQRNSTA